MHHARRGRFRGAGWHVRGGDRRERNAAVPVLHPSVDASDGARAEPLIGRRWRAVVIQHRGPWAVRGGPSRTKDCPGDSHTTFGFRIQNLSFPFIPHASSLCPGSIGRSLPLDIVSMRPASMPWLTRYALAEMARRLPSARLYSSEPRSSQFPAI